MAKNEMSDYGFNSIIKEYAGFPTFLPLPCHWEHGWTASSEAAASDLATTKSVMLVFSKRRELVWRKVSGQAVAVMGAPFVHFRKRRHITIANDAVGTIAFPGHSCSGIDAIYDIQSFAQQLRSLPDVFQPATICLHPADIRKGTGILYEHQGFKVVSAGDQFSVEFPARFYGILRAHRFATSNVVGSYSFYAVEMGIPFFIAGQLPVMDNYGGDPNVPRRYTLLDYPVGKVAYEIFNTGPIERITSAQMEFVRDEMGVDQCLSGAALGRLLWKHEIIYFLSIFTHAPKRLFGSLFRAFRHYVTIPMYLRRYNLESDNAIFTHLTPQEKVVLNQTVRIERGGRGLVCVEIGSYLGASTCFIANALAPDSVLFCIDTWQNDAMRYEDSDTDAERRDTYREFRLNTERYADKLVEVRKWSAEGVSDVRETVRSIDFLFLDGDHTYDGVKGDWDNFSPLLVAGSIVVFHDTGWAQGVRKVISEEVIARSEVIFTLANMQGFRIR